MLQRDHSRGVVLTGDGRRVTAGRRERWEQHSQVPLAVLGVVFIVCYSIVVLETDSTRVFRQVAGVIFTIAFVAFAIDYLVQIVLTPHGGRWRFVIRNPLHLLAVLLPVFRAVRVVDLFRRIRYFHRRSGTAVRAEVAIYAAAYALVFVYFLALATLQVERPVSGARIVTFEDAVWWAFETISTVGYGDMYPITGLGRFYAVLLMMGGVVIIGVISGTVVSYITDRIRTREHEDHSADPWEHGADSREHGDDPRKHGADPREHGADPREHGEGSDG